MYVLENLHWFIILLGALVFFHELGHFLVAKATGVKVLKFSLGFGPRLLGFTRGETEYVVSLLPLGGYVKMLGEVPGMEIPEEDLPRAFSSKSLWKRLAIVLAGPAFNFLLAFAVYAVVFTGRQELSSTKLGIVSQGDPAWRAGLRPGDVVTAIDGQPVDDFESLRELVSNRPGARLRMSYERNGERRVSDVQPEARDESNLFQETETRGRIGVSPQYVKPILGVVDPESPAAEASLRTGDAVTKVNGAAVESWYELRERVGSTPPAEPVRLTFVRDGAEHTVALTPARTPPGLDLSVVSSADTPHGYTGLVSRDVLVARVDPSTPAARMGLQPGDRLLELEGEKDGKSVARPIGVWNVDLAAFSGVDARSHFVLTWQRGREIISKPLTLEVRNGKDEFKNERTEYVFGAYNAPDLLGMYTFERQVGALEAIGQAARKVASDTTLIGVGIAKMVQGRIPLNTMGGPIMLFVIAEKSAKRGLETYLQMLAVISVNLGLLNLLPVPVLDGGHLLFFGIEAVRRRPPSIRTRELANIVGLALLALLMVLVFKNDLLRYVLG